MSLSENCWFKKSVPGNNPNVIYILVPLKIIDGVIL